MSIHKDIDIVSNAGSETVNGQHVEILVLQSGHALAISTSSLSLYRNKSFIGDPLGNGLLHSADIPGDLVLQDSILPWVNKVQAGFIGLSNKLVILVLPNEIKLYRNKKDALINDNMLAALPIE